MATVLYAYDRTDTYGVPGHPRYLRVALPGRIDLTCAGDVSHVLPILCSIAAGDDTGYSRLRYCAAFPRDAAVRAVAQIRAWWDARPGASLSLMLGVRGGYGEHIATLAPRPVGTR